MKAEIKFRWLDKRTKEIIQDAVTIVSWFRSYNL
jgi:hypothetical protein